MQEKPWLRHYDAGVPATLHPYPERTLLDYITDGARERPGHPALVFKGAPLTYGELERQSDAFAAALAALGVRRGDRVALLLPNCPQFVIAELGAWKAGAIVNPLNPIYTERELEEALGQTGAETLVTLGRFYGRVKHMQPRTGVKRVVVSSIKEYLPPVLRVLYGLLKEKKEGDGARPAAGDHAFQELLRRYAGAAAPGPRPEPGDAAILLMSGGTTGTPKGAIGTHHAMVMVGLQLRAWLHAILDEGNDKILLPLPLFHVYGNVTAQGLAFIGHNPLVLVPNPRDLDDIVNTIDRVRPSVFLCVPAIFSALLEHPKVVAGKSEFRSIKGCFSGASPLMADTKRRFEELTGGTIVEGYSLTEGMMATIVNPVGGVQKIGSIGIPTTDVEVRIVDAETGERELGFGEVGEIIIRAPQLMKGYWGNELETRAVLRPHGPGGPWLHTGDLGTMDEDGYIVVVDRKKDLIKVSGLQVWPREVEEVLTAHPAVAEAGVAGIPHERKGEVVKAWVVLRPGATATVEELRAYCKQQLAPFKVPAEIEFRETLPRSIMGKVLRRELRAEAAAQRVAAGA